jgi:hypothetical protein
MRRAGAIALLATALVGLLALLAEAAGDKRDLAFTIGVVPTTPAAKLRPGATVCQTNITVPTAFTRVQLRAGSPGGPGQPLGITVRGFPSNRARTHGSLAGGYPYTTEQSVPVGHVAAGQRISVCVTNRGSRRVEIWGNSGAASLPSSAYIGARLQGTDLTLVFLTDGRRSMLAQLPDVFERASVFRPGWVGAWVYWVLTALALVAVPVLLARALADASDAP